MCVLCARALAFRLLVDEDSLDDSPDSNFRGAGANAEQAEGDAELPSDAVTASPSHKV